MKIGILGGTFDPIHAGHLALARAAKNQFNLSKVLFIPAFIPPHKAAERSMTPAPYRYRMVELAIKGESSFEISHVELDRAEISYTVDTLRTLKAKYPSAELYLILGEDACLEFSTWKDPDQIRMLCRIVVAKRPGWEKKGVLAGVDGWIKMNPVDVSSSSLRIHLIEGRKIGPDQVPSEVLDYIERFGLYRKQPA